MYRIWILFTFTGFAWEGEGGGGTECMHHFNRQFLVGVGSEVVC